jgi:hypothetical protein
MLETALMLESALMRSRETTPVWEVLCCLRIRLHSQLAG